MKRYDPLTESFCDELGKEVTDLIAPLAEKYGIRFDYAKAACAPSADTVAIHAMFSLYARPASVATLKEEQDYLGYCEGFGVKEAWLGKEFTRGKFTFKVAGLMINAPNKCVVLERNDGVRCQEDGKLVARYLG
jgi:hypothetical protein